MQIKYKWVPCRLPTRAEARPSRPSAHRAPTTVRRDPSTLSVSRLVALSLSPPHVRRGPGRYADTLGYALYDRLYRCVHMYMFMYMDMYHYPSIGSR